jgi:hypothetical protein
MSNELNRLNTLLKIAQEQEFQGLCKGLYIASDYWFDVQQDLKNKIEAIQK